MQPPDVIGELLGRERVAVLRYFEAAARLPIQSALALASPERRLVSKALRVRDRQGVPFWEALLLQMMREGGTERLLSQAALHVSHRPRLLRLLPGEAASTALWRVVNARSANKMVVLSSCVTLPNGHIRYVPMMDFRIPASRASRRLVLASIRHFDEYGGYLFTSGRSYHYYGKRLLTRTGWLRFLGTALLLNPIVDSAWIGHQLVDGKCGLRISPKPGQTDGPRLVAEL